MKVNYCLYFVVLPCVSHLNIHLPCDVTSISFLFRTWLLSRSSSHSWPPVYFRLLRLSSIAVSEVLYKFFNIQPFIISNDCKTYKIITQVMVRTNIPLSVYWVKICWKPCLLEIAYTIISSVASPSIPTAFIIITSYSSKRRILLDHGFQNGLPRAS